MNKENTQEAMSVISDINNKLTILNFQYADCSNPLIQEALEKCNKDVSDLREEIKKEAIHV